MLAECFIRMLNYRSKIYLLSFAPKSESCDNRYTLPAQINITAKRDWLFQPQLSSYRILYRDSITAAFEGVLFCGFVTITLMNTFITHGEPQSICTGITHLVIEPS